MRQTIPRALVALMALGALAGPGLAQNASSEQASADPGPQYDSPRAVMRGLVDNMLEHTSHGQEFHLREAMSTWPPQSVPSAELVLSFYQVLNRIEYIDYATIAGPGDAALGDGAEIHSFGPPPNAADAVVLVRFEEFEELGWRFSPETVDSIPLWWNEYKQLPPIGDLPLKVRAPYRIRMALPPALSAQPFLMENWQWLGLLILAFAAALLDRVARLFARALLRRLARGEELDAEGVAGFARPIGLLVAAVIFSVALPLLGLEPRFLSPLDIAAAFVAAVAGVWAAYRLVEVVCDYLATKAAATDSRIDDVLVPLVRRTAKIFVAILGAVFLASKWTDDLWGVVAGLGVGSIAVAFAGRDTIENLFGTFTVLLDRPFDLGDWILVASNEGSVEEIGFRSTRIRTFYNSIITVPNRTFVTSDVDNMGRRKYRRVKTTLSLTYDTPPEKVEAFCAGVRRIIQTHPYTRKDYYHVYLNGLGDSSLDVLLYAFLECPDWGTELREKHRLFADILRLAEKLEVEFAFPTQTLHVAKPEDLAHPDRPASDVDGAVRGVAAADELVAAGLAPWGGAGTVPPPVDGPSDPHSRRGSEGEAGE